MIIDVSEGGFGLSGLHPQMEQNGVVFIDFDQIGAFRCRLAWSNGSRFGVEIIEDKVADDFAPANLTEALRGLKSKKLARK